MNLGTFSRKEMKGLGRTETRVEPIEGHIRRVEAVEVNAMILSKLVSLSLFSHTICPFTYLLVKVLFKYSSAFALVRKMSQHHGLYPFLSSI